jgi:mycothiol synthase
MAIPRQLEMVRPHLVQLPALVPTPGCELRTYRPGDETHWARIMNDCIGEGWTAEKCLDQLVQEPIFRPDGCFFAAIERVPRGSATAWQKPERGADEGYVHMVGVEHGFRGRGLGFLLTLATLHWFREHGFRRAVLHTDDWRIPAIGVYLKLGFEPVLFDAEHTRRWADVRARLTAR